MKSLQNTIEKLSSNKISNLDKILNKILKKYFETLQYHLLLLIQTNLIIIYFPKRFKIIIIFILYKSSKLNYIKPNIYHSIILENIIDKIMKNIITEFINYLIETHELLSIYHFEDKSG